MLLTFDVGNTNILLGTYQGEQLTNHWRVSTYRERTADEFAILLKNLFQFEKLSFLDITGIAISSVVPQMQVALLEMTEKYFSMTPLLIGPGIKTGMPLRFDNPREVGADRIVNAVGAYSQYGGPAIVVDFGTATTFDLVSRDGEYLGGAIAPGIGISMEALFQRAAKLPRVELAPPPNVVGRNTVNSMQSGILYGFVGQVEGIVNRMQEEMTERARVIATGGLAPLIGKHSATVEVIDEFLTLEGLRLIYQRNLLK
ncbi:type III pantothenate kinase [Metallumcola ferriviriculae]|uniref:Type III pantothenate kinase n=1 Tax=Metallumcola ferriviriculae TaxID=3039180 RepID=A0AAU0UIU4_9FIRM|nr:type III pantothenate kinase [Desulfitibacteraceae bacterium MK1]